MSYKISGPLSKQVTAADSSGVVQMGSARDVLNLLPAAAKKLTIAAASHQMAMAEVLCELVADTAANASMLDIVKLA